MKKHRKSDRFFNRSEKSQFDCYHTRRIEDSPAEKSTIKTPICQGIEHIPDEVQKMIKENAGILHPCTLCSTPTGNLEYIRPLNKKQWGIPADKERYIIYPLCEICHDLLPAEIIRKEIFLKMKGGNLCQN